MLIYDGPLNVDYRQFYVVTDWDTDRSPSSMLGQSNGLCGAAIAGHLDLRTATHSGRVALRVEQLNEEPPDDPAYEDVVEASFRPNSDHAYVQEWQGDTLAQLTVEPRWYRVRYACMGFEGAYGNEVQEDENSPPIGSDRYLLQFWPEPTSRPDVVVRVSGDLVQEWHERARHEEPPKRVFKSWVE